MHVLEKRNQRRFAPVPLSLIVAREYSSLQVQILLTLEFELNLKKNVSSLYSAAHYEPRLKPFGLLHNNNIKSNRSTEADDLRGWTVASSTFVRKINHANYKNII